MSQRTRIYDAVFKDHLARHRQMLFVSGPRQVGKTTACRNHANFYLNWDNTNDRDLILKGPSRVAEITNLQQLAELPGKILFDELHKFARWKQFLKGFFDSYETLARVIVLDPFPIAGGTTTFDALWMGVPVVTLAGDRPVGRGGLSILNTLGHPEWVGHTREDYVRAAVELASKPNRLETLRKTLREEIQKSPLMDSQGFVREMEKHYSNIWKKWCAGQR